MTPVAMAGSGKVAASSDHDPAIKLTPALPDADVVRLVARFYEINLTDPLLTPYFTQSRMPALRAKFARFVVHGLAGLPMDRRRLRRIHHRLGIGDIEFAACAKNLLTALSEQPRLENKLKDQLLMLLWELESDITVEGGMPVVQEEATDSSNGRASYRHNMPPYSSSSNNNHHSSSSYSANDMGSTTASVSSVQHTSGEVIYLDDLQEVAAEREAAVAVSDMAKPAPKRSGWRSLFPW